MSTREEKLAAARKKLKEFQGKHKDPDSKQKNARNFRNWSEPSNESSPSCTPIFDDRSNTEDNVSLKSGNSIHSDSPLNHKDNFVQESVHFNSFNYPYLNPVSESFNLENGGKFNQDVNNHHKSFCSDAISEGISNMHISQSDSSNLMDSFNPNGRFDYSHLNHYATESSRNNFQEKKSVEIDNRLSPKQFFENPRSTPSSDAVLNDVLQPLQLQLQNHVQTISILVGERNDLQAALANAQSLLTLKTTEVEDVNKKLQSANGQIYGMETRLKDLENVIQSLVAEKEQLEKKNEIDKSELEKWRLHLESKEEEQSELRQRLEAKNRECENLFHNLRESQAQLSMCQIKIQQLNVEDSATPGSQIMELQHENLILKKRIEELEKVLEVTNAEKEQSSQNFHVYAEQCNSQIAAINAQLKDLTTEKQTLEQKNDSLSKTIEELELKLKQKEPSSEKYETEIANLHSQVNVITEANNKLQQDFLSKEEEIKALQNQLQEKIQEFNELEGYLHEVKSEKARLQSEIESSNANERLLAAMESDKVAAARAVSQNQKLKEQLLELEGGFVKLSHEKLELTDQLAHERHVNKELQSRLDSHQHLHDHDHDHDHDHGHEDCHHGEKPEPPINDSDEIEELRNIVRQLQEDKAELLNRLNQSNFPKKTSFHEELDHHHHEDCSHHHENSVHQENMEQCENSKLLLQQMEEKVKKTMNEIAVLDEEKQKLEHLVLQLQGETETIGEYISLYQKQRMLLRQRTKEKDEQLIQLSKDKEELRSKLAALDDLVQHLLQEKGISSSTADTEIAKTIDDFIQAPGQVDESDAKNTAGKIRALITEIGSTNLVNSHSVAFEHCPCCSGRLITI